MFRVKVSPEADVISTYVYVLVKELTSIVNLRSRIRKHNAYIIGEM